MWFRKKNPQAVSFTFGTYKVDANRSTITFTYKVEFKSGRVRTFTDRLVFKDVAPELWATVPPAVLEPTLEALLLMLGINYWCVYPSKNIKIENFKLTKDQAKFWDELYLNGLGEFFYDMKMDFRNLIAFPYDESLDLSTPAHLERRALGERALLLNGAGKDSILSAEMLKASGMPFDFFAFAPTPAHKRIGNLVGAKTIEVTRRMDPRIDTLMSWYGVSTSYPSVSTFTFVAVLLAELLGYSSIVFSNERSADFGNLTYLGLPVNHQWCKSTEAENLVNDYIGRFITPDMKTYSLLRKFSELEIVRRFVEHPKYLPYVTSCNMYFWLPHPLQIFRRKAYWCKRCPKCVFLFACFAAYLSKEEVIKMFGADLYTKKRLLPLVRRILGLEGFKPLDCVGEPEEMILAMHMGDVRKEYQGEPAMEMFKKNFNAGYNFDELKEKVFES